jgi:tetratricopeptide (TPR) repeat protein
LLISVSACQTSRSIGEGGLTPEEQQQKMEQSLNDRERSQVYQAILTAELALGNNDLETALTYYLYALTLLPDQKIATEAIQLAQKTKDPAALIEAANAWLQLDPNNTKAIESKILGLLMQFDLASDLREESLNAALEACLQLIRLSPNKADAYRELTGLNRVYLQASTLALWQFYLRNNSDDPLAWTLLADAYYRAAEMTGELSYLQKAEPTVAAALRKDPSFKPAIELKIDIMRKQNPGADVVTFLETLLLDNPNNTSALQVLAQEYYRQKRYDKAISLTQQLIKQDEQDMTSRYLLAASYYGSGDFKRAHQQFIQLVAADYRPDLSLFYCGDTAERIEAWNQAIACYKQVPPGNYWYSAQQRLSDLLIQQGKQQEALDRLEKLALNAPQPQAEQAVVLRAEALLQLNETLGALEWLTRFIDQQLQSLQVPLKHSEVLQTINPDQDWKQYADNIAERLSESLKPSWYRALAGQFVQAEQYQSAIDLLSHAINRYSDDVDLRYARALLHEKTGDMTKLESELRQVYAMAPENPHVQNALGYTLADSNKELDFAQQLIEQAYQRLPQSGAVLDSLGWLYYRQGELDKAEHWLRKAMELEPAAEVLAHLLEVLSSNQKNTEAKILARRFWSQYQNNPRFRQVIENLQLLEPNNP